jgi:hypothetical protein
MIYAPAAYVVTFARLYSYGCEPVSPGFILPYCRYRPVQADAGLPAWSSLPTELKSLSYWTK